MIEMSYDFVLADEDGIIDHFYETWNRSKLYYDNLDSELGLRWLYGKKYDEVKERVEKFIEIAGTDVIGSKDFWDEKCSGRSGILMKKVLDIVKEHPDCVFEGD